MVGTAVGGGIFVGRAVAVGRLGVAVGFAVGTAVEEIVVEGTCV
jgi:small-conductance mechanosensitive channel